MTPDENVPDESAQWAELQKEMEKPDLVESVAEPTEPAGSPAEIDEELTALEAKLPAEKVAKKEPAEPKPEEPSERELSPDELKVQYKNLQAALRESREETRAQQQTAMQILERWRNRDQTQPRTQQPQPQQPQIPTMEEDPIGHFQARMLLLERELQQTKQGTYQTAQQLQEREQLHGFISHVERSEQDFRKEKPDYDAACLHLEQSRIKELHRLYPDNSQRAQAIAQQYGFPNAEHLKVAILNQDRINVAQNAVTLGISPAQHYYEMAVERGYNPNVTKISKQDTAKAIMDAAKRGVKASATISGGGGSKAPDDMGLLDLADLFVDDPDEADKIWDKMKRQGKLG